jgi:hypothetical protein
MADLFVERMEEFTGMACMDTEDGISARRRRQRAGARPGHGLR